MEKRTSYQLPNGNGHVTMFGDKPPSKELMETLQKVGEIALAAYERGILPNEAKPIQYMKHPLIETETTKTWSKQTKLGGANGNCMMTCIAHVLGLNPAEVPPIEEFFSCLPTNFWTVVANEYYRLSGYVCINSKSHTKIAAIADGRYYFGIGNTTRGILHQCVFQNCTLVFDPHPEGKGLLEADFFEVLIPISEYEEKYKDTINLPYPAPNQ